MQRCHAGMWEVYRVEHLAFVSTMEASLESRLQCSRHVGYSALRCMACANWQCQHACPICKKSDRNHSEGKDPWSYLSGCLDHVQSGVGCMGSRFDAESPEVLGVTVIPSLAVSLKEL